MNHRTYLSVTAGLALLAVSGCSGSTLDAGELGDEAAVTNESDSVQEVPVGPRAEVLHQFTVQGTKYVMAAGDGNSVMTMATSPSFAQPMPHERLLAEYGPLTQLEIYLALAPDGEPPRELLLDYHNVEAEAMGRADPSVETVRFDPDAPVEKWASPCVTYALNHVSLPNPNWGFKHLHETFDDGDGDVQTQFMKEPLALAACDTSGADWRINSGGRSSSTSAFNWFGEVNMPPSSKAVIWWGYTTFAKQLRSITFGSQDIAGVIAWSEN